LTCDFVLYTVQFNVFLLHKRDTLSRYVITLFMLITIKIVINC